MRDKDWYTERWKNKRALKKKALRQAKYSDDDTNQAISEEGIELIIYDSSQITTEKHVGILAAANYPTYSILYGKRFILGKMESQDQGKLLNQLAIGDKVVFEMEGDNPTIKGITPRKSQIVRLRADASRRSLAGAEEHVIAANIDIAVIVASVVQPTFHPKLVDRYLIMCQYGNVTPILCLTKIDLDPMPDLSTYQQIDLPTFGISNKTQEGVDKLLEYLKGKCCVLVGNSGVGKSSLINSLLNREVLLTGDVSEKSGKGKHTTSTSSLHIIEENTLLIDTPGIRSLGLWNIDPESLRLYFPEFTKFAANCAFNDCSHTHEPRCAVKKAVEEGLIPKERYESYLRLLEKS